MKLHPANSAMVCGISGKTQERTTPSANRPRAHSVIKPPARQSETEDNESNEGDRVAEWQNKYLLPVRETAGRQEQNG